MGDSGLKADPEKLKLNWAFRLSGDGFGGYAPEQKSSAPAPEPAPAGESFHNQLFFIGGRFDALRMLRLSQTFYLGYGANASVGSISAQHCSAPLQCVGNKCQCTDDVSKWNGIGVKYGPELGLAMKLHQGFPYLALWLPTLHVEHLIAVPTRRNATCAESSDSCGAPSLGNIALSATADLAWSIHDMLWSSERLDAAGCGFGGGVMLLYGDLADRERVRLMATFHIGLHLELLGL